MRAALYRTNAKIIADKMSFLENILDFSVAGRAQSTTINEKPGCSVVEFDVRDRVAIQDEIRQLKSPVFTRVKRSPNVRDPNFYNRAYYCR